MLLMQLFSYAGVSAGSIQGIIISSVVPPVNPTLERTCFKYLRQRPMFVGPGIKTGLHIRTENPRETGADRIVNAVAAIQLYGPPLIIVDFGTATTFCYIDKRGDYIGGAIAPGIGISTEALYNSAAKLPRIELSKPKSIVGRTTISSMQSGMIYGFAGQVDGIVQRICEEQGVTPRVIATGGFAELIGGESRTIDIVNPLLTLEGLRIIYERNTG